MQPSDSYPLCVERQVFCRHDCVEASYAFMDSVQARNPLALRSFSLRKADVFRHILLRLSKAVAFVHTTGSRTNENEQECYVVLKRGRPVDDEHFWYLDAIEEALCFGWVDSTVRRIDGISMQRFSPRRKGGNWTELNKERVRRLEKLGLMTDAGRKVLPPMGLRSFRIDPETEAELKKARVWSKFKALPPLYQRVRASNLLFYRNRYAEGYQRMLEHTIQATKNGKTFGEWNDYGRLSNY